MNRRQNDEKFEAHLKAQEEKRQVEEEAKKAADAAKALKQAPKVIEMAPLALETTAEGAVEGGAEGPESPKEDN